MKESSATSPPFLRPNQAVGWIGPHEVCCMPRDRKFWLIVPLLCLWPLSASADDGEVTKVLSECGAADLPQASLDSCIERVRVLEETEPSSRLQTLEASLEQRESGRAVRARTAAPARPPAAEVASEPYMAAQGRSERN